MGARRYENITGMGHHQEGRIQGRESTKEGSRVLGAVRGLGQEEGCRSCRLLLQPG